MCGAHLPKQLTNSVKQSFSVVLVNAERVHAKGKLLMNHGDPATCIVSAKPTIGTSDHRKRE